MFYVNGGECVDDEFNLILKIVDRAEKTLDMYQNNRMILLLDLIATHAKICPLDLQALSKTDDFAFITEIQSIQKYICRKTVTFKNGFSPYFKKSGFKDVEEEQNEITFIETQVHTFENIRAYFKESIDILLNFHAPETPKREHRPYITMYTKRKKIYFSFFNSAVYEYSIQIIKNGFKQNFIKLEQGAKETIEITAFAFNSVLKNPKVEYSSIVRK